jgi:hypothetical protein
MAFTSLTPERKQLLDAAMDRPFGGQRLVTAQRLIQPTVLKGCLMAKEINSIDLKQRIKLRSLNAALRKNQRLVWEQLNSNYPVHFYNEDLRDELKTVERSMMEICAKLYGDPIPVSYCDIVYCVNCRLDP